jgi:fluoride exporter
LIGLPLCFGLLLGGAVGTVARVLISQQLLPAVPGSFPVGTLLVNWSGCFLMGLLTGAMMFAFGPELSLTFVVLGYGFLGAFTTVSSLSVECLMMLRAGHARLAIGYLAASVAGGLLLTGAGLGLMLAWSRVSLSW